MQYAVHARSVLVKIILECVSLHFYLAELLPFVLTRDRGAKSHEGDGIHTIFEVNEASQVTGDVTNDCSTHPNCQDRDDKGWITISNGCNVGSVE